MFSSTVRVGGWVVMAAPAFLDFCRGTHASTSVSSCIGRRIFREPDPCRAFYILPSEHPITTARTITSSAFYNKHVRASLMASRFLFSACLDDFKIQLMLCSKINACFQVRRKPPCLMMCAHGSVVNLAPPRRSSCFSLCQNS